MSGDWYIIMYHCGDRFCDNLPIANSIISFQIIQLSFNNGVPFIYSDSRRSTRPFKTPYDARIIFMANMYEVDAVYLIVYIRGMLVL